MIDNQEVTGYYGNETVEVTGHECRAANVIEEGALRIEYDCVRCGRLSNAVTAFDQFDCSERGVAVSILANEWTEKARENVEKWGLQDTETLLLAMQEEQGELAQAYLEANHESGDPERIAEELDDLAALCIQLQWRLEADE